LLCLRSSCNHSCQISVGTSLERTDEGRQVCVPVMGSTQIPNQPASLRTCRLCSNG
jgi:hypothetical protein